MTFEMMDWDAEAERIKRAFRLKGECRFQKQTPDNVWDLLEDKTSFLQIPNDNQLRLYYAEGCRFITIDKPGEYGKLAFIAITWADSVMLAQSESELSPIIAKALFHLDLLTPEVEAALKVSVSAHEKLEWGREYEERYGCRK